MTYLNLIKELFDVYPTIGFDLCVYESFLRCNLIDPQIIIDWFNVIAGPCAGEMNCSCKVVPVSINFPFEEIRVCEYHFDFLREIVD